MGAEFLSVRKSGPKMILWGSAALVAIYLLTTLGTMMALPGDEIDPVTGVIGMLDVAGFPGLMEVCAIVLAFIIIVALMTYQVAYSRLIFVSGLERHLPRIFTHLNPRTRNPVTAILIQGVISSLILVGLYSQSSMANVTIYLQGGLSTVWLLSGFFFLIPVVVARKKYADRYASEQFWRIPGGMAGVWTAVIVGSLGTVGGIYYSFVTPWIDVPTATWMTWVGGISLGMFALGLTVYVFGRRSAHKVSQEDSLAHLAVFDLNKTETEESAK
jgi:amino acid transporter